MSKRQPQPDQHQPAKLHTHDPTWIKAHRVHIAALRDLNGHGTAILIDDTWHTSTANFDDIRDWLTAAEYEDYFGKPY